MGLFKKREILNKKELKESMLEMVTVNNGGQYMYSGNLYDSDIVKSCIRAKVRAAGKLEANHIQANGKEIKTNPDAYMQNLLRNPNPIMSGKQYQEKMITQLELNGNAFARIYRDQNGFPIARIPIDCSSVRVLYDGGKIRLEFYLMNGKRKTLPYSDVLHYRHDYNSDDFFGSSPAKTLVELLETIGTVDDGIKKAVRNGQLIKFLLKSTLPLTNEKAKANAKRFRDNFMTVEGDSFGVAVVDNANEVIELKPNDFVPNGMVFTQYHKRVMALFGTNEKIITSEFTEDEWNSYFEATVEPDALEMGIEDTRKLFTPKDAQTNKIVYEASNLACASFKTRIELQAMVDRGALTPNEWRATFNRAPLPGGDQPIRRLDTQVVNLAHKLLDKGAEVNDVLALLGGEKEWQGL